MLKKVCKLYLLRQLASWIMVKFIVQLVLTIYYFIDYVKSYVIIS